MTPEQRENYLMELEDEYLLGVGGPFSEWSIMLSQEVDTAFRAGADLAAVLTAQAVIESHLRYEYFDPRESKGWGLYRLVRELESRLQHETGLIDDLDALRLYRNKWVHVADPTDDQHLAERPEVALREAEEMAILAMRTMVRVLFLEQGV